MASTELPITKIKRMAKFDPDVKLISQEGALALTLSCELFIKSLAKHVYQYTIDSKRRTVQIRDFDLCMQQTPAFAFLDGALETWTDVAGPAGGKRKKISADQDTGPIENPPEDGSGYEPMDDEPNDLDSADAEETTEIAPDPTDEPNDLDTAAMAEIEETASDDNHDGHEGPDDTAE